MDGTTQTSVLIAQTSTPAPTPTLPPKMPTPPGLDWTTIIVAVVTGVATGIIAPIITPYVKWHLEKERRRHERRLELVEAWRNTINDENMTIHQMLDSPTFPSLKRMLSPASMQEFEELRNNYKRDWEAFVEEELDVTFKGLTTRQKMLKTEELTKNQEKERFFSRAKIIATLDGKAMRDFLRKELAEIETKWGLL
ncbi:MAG: hypothetical protein ACFCVB_12170 [Nodosilinea sp.]